LGKNKEKNSNVNNAKAKAEKAVKAEKAIKKSKVSAEAVKPKKALSRNGNSRILSIDTVVASLGCGIAANILTPYVMELLAELGSALQSSKVNDDAYQQQVKDINRLSAIYLELTTVSEEADERIRKLISRYQEVLLQGWREFLASSHAATDVGGWLHSRIEKFELMDQLLEVLPERQRKEAIKRVKL
jgi:hypothetical protein